MSPSESLDDAETSPPSRVGMVLADRYELTRLIGHGGMGSVYEARHKSLDRRFAIKFLLPEYSRNKEMLRRFENEAKAAGRLEHINIAAVTDFGRAPDGALFLVMEFLPGRDCAAELGELGPFSIARATNIVYQACMGLTVAHQAGIVHRDIKPENLLLAKGLDGEDLVKILDFGIAKLRNPQASAMTASGVTMGTLFYMSPEQIRDSSKVDERADVWSLGVLLYELLTNVRPFDGENVTSVLFRIAQTEPARIESLRPDLPRVLADAIHGALKKDPEKRLASAKALADAIRPYANRRSIPSPALDLATSETVAAISHAATPRASTSQLGAAEIQQGSRKLRKALLWPLLLGIAGIGIVLSTLRSRSSVQTDVGPAPRDSQRPATSSATSVELSSVPVLASSLLTEHVRTAPASSSDNSPLASDRKVVLSRSLTSARRPQTPQASAVPSITREVPLPRKTSSSSGVPITIDPYNPF